MLVSMAMVVEFHREHCVPILEKWIKNVPKNIVLSLFQNSHNTRIFKW